MILCQFCQDVPKALFEYSLDDGGQMGTVGAGVFAKGPIGELTILTEGGPVFPWVLY